MSEPLDHDSPARSLGTSYTVAYEVEARCVGDLPQIVNGQIFDQKWRVVKIERAQVGVPSALEFAGGITGEFLTYTAAEAIRWWFCAQCEQQGHISMLFETRLVEYRIEQSYAVRRARELNGIGFKEIIKQGRP